MAESHPSHSPAVPPESSSSVGIPQVPIEEGHPQSTGPPLPPTRSNSRRALRAARPIQPAAKNKTPALPEKQSSSGQSPAASRRRVSGAQPSAKSHRPASHPEDELPPHTVPWRQQAVVFAISLGIHLLVFLVLGFMVLPQEYKDPFLSVLGALPKPPEPKKLEEPVELEQPQEVEDQQQQAQIAKKFPAKKKDRFEIDVNLKPPSADINPDPNANAPAAQAPNRGEFAGRSKAGRQFLLTKYGGTKASEGAVQRGLEWLSRHQNSDGSWSFDHRHIPGCDCKGAGSLKRSNMGATAMALLCFLGHGDTYSQGDYGANVEKGLMYLLRNEGQTAGQPNGDFRGNYEANSGMYIQGLVAIVLCEAYAMNELERTADLDRRGKKSRLRSRMSNRRRLAVSRQLRYAAERAIAFITRSQASNGGWRYQPGQPGDTSVTGWQVMALAAAHNAKLRYLRQTVQGISRFLDAVQMNEGAFYGYTGPQRRPSTTAVGLLCRIYLGWKRNNPSLRVGVEYLSKTGPSRNNMYYNYYATQVMHQYGGPLWKKWNDVMRDRLVNTQIKTGHARGSWNVTDPHGRLGGRLYQTCLSIMTLEVYYRHLPLYDQRDLDSKKSTNSDGFSERSRKKAQKKSRKKRGSPRSPQKKK